MKLILLHGPPASGKLTLARALSEKTGYSVMHNHLSVDLALSVYPEFGHSDFFQFVDQLRLMSIRKACENGFEGLIATMCFDINDDLPAILDWQKLVEEYNGELFPIYLDVTEQELSHRVQQSTRHGTHKLQCPHQLKQALSDNAFGPVPLASTQVVSTSNLGISTSVEHIIPLLAAK